MSELPIQEAIQRARTAVFAMCREKRGPKLCIPVRETDEDQILIRVLDYAEEKATPSSLGDVPVDRAIVAFDQIRQIILSAEQHIPKPAEPHANKAEPEITEEYLDNLRFYAANFANAAFDNDATGKPLVESEVLNKWLSSLRTALDGIPKGEWN